MQKETKHASTGVRQEVFLLAGFLAALGLGTGLTGSFTSLGLIFMLAAAGVLGFGIIADAFAGVGAPRARAPEARPATGTIEAAAATPAGVHAQMEDLATTVLRPLTTVSAAYWAVVAVLAAVVALGVFAYTQQAIHGLEVTGLNDKVAWGFYITNFVFFIGISHAGTLISAILRLTGAEWRRPITRMAELITVVALTVGPVMIIIDMGRPDRVYNMILHGRMQSPLIWDMLSIGTYLTGSITYLYLPMIPDIAACRDRLGATAARWRRWLYTTLALGWRGTQQQKQRLNKAIGVMAIVIVPVAVSVHTVVSYVFSMTLRPGWNSTVFGPYFVIGAIFSGIASILIVMAIFRKIYHLEAYITDKHFRYLGYLLLVFTALYMYFTLSEYLTTGYKMTVDDKALLEQLMLGRYAVYFWIFAIGGLVVPAILLVLPQTANVPGIVTAAVLINIGMWIKRLMIIVPSMGLPQMPYEWGGYTPTWVEWSILAASVAGFALVFVLFSKLFPLISLWEVEEGMELEAAKAGATVAQPVADLREPLEHGEWDRRWGR
jgi:molybdopterin-containing oxidoreductase family membrane subunit